MTTDAPSAGQRRTAYLAWAVLVFTVLVVLGGAVVRATGSGDGCGASWPRCTGRLIPMNPGAETMIEFSHRLMTLAMGVGVVLLVVMAFRFFPRGHLARTAAIVTLALLIVESLLGAGLVVFGWVDQDDSMGRVLVVPLHLVNTFLLLGSAALTAWWASGYPPPRTTGSAPIVRRLGIGALGVMVIGATGALNALADSLYPPESFLGGVADELSASSPWLVRLRVFHPLIAIAIALGLLYLVLRLGSGAGERTRKLGLGLAVVVGLQFFVGIANVILLTPLETQVLHLALADALWIIYVLFSASLLGEPVLAGRPERSPV